MRSVIVASAALWAVSAHAQDAPAMCESLASSLKLNVTTVTSSIPVTSGQFMPLDGQPLQANLPAFCRVELTIAPTGDSDIKTEVWLPMSGWNGRFLAVGNGAWGGSIQYNALGNGIRRGYATASTDTGHTGSDASFAIGHPEKLIDFGSRAVHQMAAQGKATVDAFYNKAPDYSYFNGCSGGGRQSFMEAQR